MPGIRWRASIMKHAPGLSSSVCAAQCYGAACTAMLRADWLHQQRGIAAAASVCPRVCAYRAMMRHDKLSTIDRKINDLFFIDRYFLDWLIGLCVHLLAICVPANLCCTDPSMIRTLITGELQFTQDHALIYQTLKWLGGADIASIVENFVPEARIK